MFTFQVSFWVAAVFGVGGYVASIFTWPKVREWISGKEVELEALKQKAKDLEAKIKERL